MSYHRTRRKLRDVPASVQAARLTRNYEEQLLNQPDGDVDRDVSEEFCALHCPHDGDCSTCDIPDLRQEAAMLDVEQFASANGDNYQD